MPVLPLSLLLGFTIGLSLGLLGGGGSILTVPALVYLVGQTPQAAVTASLAIVGANSALGAVFHRSNGNLNWRVAVLFGGVGMIASYLAAGLARGVPPALLLVAFALLMLLVGGLMLFRQQQETGDAEHPLRLWKILGSGAAVGFLTGILGVGGGFLIVPALVMMIGLPMRQAVGTSLVVIAMNSLAGFLGHLSGVSIDVPLITAFMISGLAGTFTGARLAGHLRAEYLRRIFALFVVALAFFLLVDNLPKLMASM